MSLLIVAAKPTTLKSPLAAADTSVILKEFVDRDGNDLAMSAFGEFGTIVVKQGETWELIKFSAVSQNATNCTLTVASSGRSVLPISPYTGASTGEDFSAGADVIVTNDPLIMSKFANLENAQTFSEIQTFTQSPVVPTPLLDSDAASKEYVDTVVTAGAPDSNTTTAGLVEEATEAEIEAGTAAGSDAQLVVNPSTLKSSDYGTKVYGRIGDYATDAVGTDAYAITLAPAATAYTAGMLIQFKPGTRNTGACTIAVNGLTAKDIKIGGANPADGDLDPSYVYILIYDGTNFEVLNPKARTPAGSIQLWGTSTAPGGFLLCDGSAVSRSTYAVLFAVISTTFGVGDGSTTFNVPNLKNRVPVGVDTTVKLVLEDCEDAWNEAVDSDVTSSLDASDFVVGSGSAKLVVTSGASAGDKLATEAISSKDLSGQTHVSLWIKSTVATAAGDLALMLDDSANCASPLETIDIPALVANTWTRVHLPLANPGSDTAIVSIGLKYVVDIGAVTINIDDVCYGENFEVGANGGVKTHTLLTAEIPSHAHSYDNSLSGGGPATGAAASNPGTAGTTGSAGGGKQHPNMQPYLTMNFIIKV